jgi:predicted ester cyclase
MTIADIMKKERWATEEAFIKNNFDALDEANVFDSNADFYVPPFPKLNGLKAFKQFIMRSAQMFSQKRWEWNEIIIEGNIAVQSYTFTAKHTGEDPDGSFPVTGKEIILEGCAIYKIKNDKIIEFKEFSNYLGVFQQMGLVPSFV